MLLKKERNELFGLIADFGMKHTDFTEHNTLSLYSLNRKGSPFWFTAKENGPFVQVDCYPKSSINGFSSHDPMYWNSAFSVFAKWLQIIRQEDDTPDLWAEAQANSKLFGRWSNLE